MCLRCDKFLKFKPALYILIMLGVSVHVFVCVLAYIFVCLWKMSVCVRVLYLCVCESAWVFACMCLCMDLYVPLCVSLCASPCVSVSLCSVSLCVCVYDQSVH